MLNLSGGDGDTATPMDSMAFIVMAALGQIKRERITDLVAKPQVAGKDIGGRRPTFSNSQAHNALRLTEGGESATQVTRTLGGPGPPYIGKSASCRTQP